MIDNLIKVGLKGLIIASLLAALMSSVGAAINSSSTLFSIDIVKRLKPNTSDKQLVLIGRITGIVVMILAILWSTQADKFGSTIIYTVNALAAMIAPPIAAVFLLGMFWKRGTATAANYTFAFGLITGIFIFLFDFPYQNLIPGLDRLAEVLANLYGVDLLPDTKAVVDIIGVNFMMQAWWKFVLCSLLFVVVSYATPKPTESQIANCINIKEFWPKKWSGISDYRVIGISIFTVLFIIWLTLEIVA
jgi:SSS family solute:Na+ symporter